MFLDNNLLVIDRAYFDNFFKDDYKSKINDILKIKDFNSIYKIRNFQFTNSLRVDNQFLDKSIYIPDFLQTILNSDGEVVIDKYFLKFNFEDKVIYSTLYNDSNNIQNIHNKNYNNNGIVSCSFSKEVLPLLDSLYSLNNNLSSRQEWSLICTERWARSNDQVKDATSFGYYIKEEYNKFGAYFEIRYTGSIFSNHPDYFKPSPNNG